MALIVAFLPHVAFSQRLRAAIRGRHELLTCSDWASVLYSCDENPVQIAVIDLYAEGSVRFDHVRQLRSRHPRVSLIAYAEATPERTRDIFDAGRYGFDGLILAGQDESPTAILAEIAQAESRGVTAAVRHALGKVAPLARDVVLLAVSRAHERLSPDALARIVGTRRVQLNRLLDESGLPSASRVLTWGRLVVAAHLLEDPRRNADGVARLLRFPSGSAFRNTCSRYLGAAPNVIRAQGGANYAIGAFQKELRGAPSARLPGPHDANPPGRSGPSGPGGRGGAA